MSRFYLRRLTIEGFRGINNEGAPLILDFHIDGVNSIYAINAYGKSSIFEALQYAITGKVIKLAHLPTAEHADDYYNNLFHTGSAKIELTLVPDNGSPDVTVVVERTKSGVRTTTSPSGYPNPDALLKSLASDLVLLDYTTFQRFIEDSPLERGRSFASLVGLSQLSELRQALDVLANTGTLRRDFEMDTLDAENTRIRNRGTAANARLRESHEELLGRPPAEPLADVTIKADVLAALKAVPLLTQLVTASTLDDVDFPIIDAQISNAEGSDLRTELSGIVSKLSHLGALAPADGAAEATEQGSIRESIGKRNEALAKTQGAEFLTLLDAASTLLHSGQWKEPHKCPLCGSNVKDLIQHVVSTHLTQYKLATTEQERIAHLWEQSTWGVRLSSCELSQTLAIPKPSRVLGRLDAKLKAGTVSLIEFEQVITALSSADQQRHLATTQALSRKTEIEGVLPPSLVALTKQVQHAKDIHQALLERDSLKKEWIALRQTQIRRTQWQVFITEAAERAAVLEVTISRARTERIEAECLSLFESIMNRPAITPSLGRGEKEDLHLQLERFYELNNVSATALLSESFRNALAISIFLSAMLESRPNARFVMLDDITSSFDAGYQFRLMETLRTQVSGPTNRNGPQVIVLSHDSLLEKYFDRHGNTPEWHHQKLQGSPPQGLLLGQTQAATRIKDLAKQLLNAGQVEQGQPLVRQYLEYVLNQVIRRVAIPVPIDFAMRDNTRMIGPSLNAIDGAVNLQKAAGSLILASQQVSDLTTMHAPAIIANWISHYETGGTAAIAPRVLLGVIDSIDAYANCFKFDCRCAGGVQRKWYKSLSEKGCAC